MGAKMSRPKKGQKFSMPKGIKLGQKSPMSRGMKPNSGPK